jgi:glutamate-1-semialdehyde 2,1-aminomutase
VKVAKVYSNEKSKQLYEKAKVTLVKGIASSFHKAAYEEFPIYFEYGKGSKIYDVDGNEYIEYGDFGPMILGYCHPSIDKAVMEQLAKGSLFPGPYRLLHEFSERITRLLPCAERILFANTGTDANMVSFRLARAYTGKEKIIKFEGHYHGWSDEQLISVRQDSLNMMGPRNNPWRTRVTPGQPEKSGNDLIILPWNDLDIVEKTVKHHSDEIAAIIAEPIMANAELVFPQAGYLQGLREITQEEGILLIFDEIITGFRVSLGGAQKHYNVIPDLCAFGKAVAGGHPLAGVAGRKDIVETDVEHAGTFNANPIAVAAGNATLKELEKPGVYENMTRLMRKVTEGINRIAREKGITLFCRGEGGLWQLAFGINDQLVDYRDSFRVDKKKYQQFRTESLRHGVHCLSHRGRMYMSTAHTDEDIEKTLAAFEEVTRRIRL